MTSNTLAMFARSMDGDLRYRAFHHVFVLEFPTMLEVVENVDEDIQVVD